MCNALGWACVGDSGLAVTSLVADVDVRWKWGKHNVSMLN